MTKKKQRVLNFNIKATLSGVYSPDYDLFGSPCFICPECAKTEKDFKECFLDNLSMLIRNYGLEDESKLSLDARELKQRILDAVVIEELKA